MSLMDAVRRRLPGVTIKNDNGEPRFHKGVVDRSLWGMTGPFKQIIQLEDKFIGMGVSDGRVALIGSTYAYWCKTCIATIWDQEMFVIPGAVRSGKVTEQKCPHCSTPVLPLQPGTKVRCHYRFDPEGKWGHWWAEAVEL